MTETELTHAERAEAGVDLTQIGDRARYDALKQIVCNRVMFRDARKVD